MSEFSLDDKHRSIEQADKSRKDNSYHRYKKVINFSKEDLMNIRDHLSESLDDTLEGTNKNRQRKIFDLVSYILGENSYEKLVELYPRRVQLTEYLGRIISIQKILKNR